MGKIAFVFSGQGAQFSGMGRELCECSPAAAAVFRLADSLRPGTSQQCFFGEAEELSRTINTQPCLFCADLAAAEALRERGIVPDAVAGFSLGELPALAFAGALSHREGFEFVCCRAAAMEDCARKNPGAMFAVIGLPAREVETLCAAIPDCWAVNYNSPVQTAVACAEGSAEALAQAVKEQRGRAVRLAVSGPMHSPYMRPASEQLRAEYPALCLQTHEIPVYANRTAQPYGDAQLLFEQVCSPVRWTETIENMLAAGVDTFVETGVGKTLGGLIRKIAPQAAVLQVQDAKSLKQTLEVLYADR